MVNGQRWMVNGQRWKVKALNELQSIKFLKALNQKEIFEDFTPSKWRSAGRAFTFDFSPFTCYNNLSNKTKRFSKISPRPNGVQPGGLSPFTFHHSLVIATKQMNTKKISKIHPVRMAFSLAGFHLWLFTFHLWPFTIHHSPFTIHLSPFTFHLSPFTIHHSPLTIHHSPFTFDPSIISLFYSTPLFHLVSNSLNLW